MVYQGSYSIKEKNYMFNRAKIAISSSIRLLGGLYSLGFLFDFLSDYLFYNHYDSYNTYSWLVKAWYLNLLSFLILMLLPYARIQNKKTRSILTLTFLFTSIVFLLTPILPILALNYINGYGNREELLEIFFLVFLLPFLNILVIGYDFFKFLKLSKNISST